MRTGFVVAHRAAEPRPLICPVFVLETQWFVNMWPAHYLWSGMCLCFLWHMTASACHSAAENSSDDSIRTKHILKVILFQPEAERKLCCVLKIKLSSINASSTKTESQHRVQLTVHLLEHWMRKMRISPSLLHRFDSSFCSRHHSLTTG